MYSAYDPRVASTVNNESNEPERSSKQHPKLLIQHGVL